MTEQPFSQTDRSTVIERYSRRLDVHGHSPLSVGWGPKDRQFARFAVLASQWDLHGMRILDIGAGFGDLFAYLAPLGIDSYLGIDVVPGLVAVGNEQYGTDGRFKLLEAEFLDLGLKGDFDVAFISGMFNFKLANGRNYDFISDVMAKAFGACKVGVAANFINDRTDYQEDLIFYANESVVLTHCFELTRRVNLRADYFPFEFSIFLHKEDTFSTDSAIFSAYRGEV